MGPVRRRVGRDAHGAQRLLAPGARPRPQVDDDAQLPNWRRWAKLRTQLYPYIAAALAEYQRSGLPLMRHLVLVAPDDAEAVGRDDEFLFGPDLLAAPVLDPGARSRDVYLPDGAWVDLWRAGRVRLRDGRLRARRGSRHGRTGTTVTLAGAARRVATARACRRGPAAAAA